MQWSLRQASFNTRADGLAAILVKKLKDATNVYQNDRNEYLSAIAHQYRTTPNDAIGFTPYYVLCAVINTMWLKRVQQHLREYTDQLTERMITIWETMGVQVRRNGLKIQNKHDDAEAKLTVYLPGQLVAIDKGKYRGWSALKNR